MNINHCRVRPSHDDLRERNTVAINVICSAFKELPMSEDLIHELPRDHREAAAAFLLSGVSRRAQERSQLLSELDRHFVMRASTWQHAVDALLTPGALQDGLRDLEKRLGEAFTSYLTFDEERVRERLDEDYVAIDTTRGIFLFSRRSIDNR